MRKYCITGDIKKAFLQIKLDQADRDAQRLFWYNNLEERKIIAYRFTRVIFGSAPSLNILGATFEKHVDHYKEAFPKTVKDLKDNTYVDDVQSGGDTKEELVRFKEEAMKIMGEGGFQLHKWHSNASVVDNERTSELTEGETTYANFALGAQTPETKILGIPWNTKTDEFTISF